LWEFITEGAIMAKVFHELEAGTAADIGHRGKMLPLHDRGGVGVNLKLPFVMEKHVIEMHISISGGISFFDAVVLRSGRG
jgi:hypothetical protein